MSKILVVDDAAFMRMMIRDVLTNNGYDNVYEAVDGLDAVEKYKNIHPDLVLMDISLPKMNGLESFKAMKAFDPGALVILLSTMGQESIVIDGIMCGVKDFIVKPLKPDRILKTISTVLN